MEIRYTYKHDGKFLIGRLDEYPDYPTQAFDIEELEANLKDIYIMIQRGELDGDTCHGVMDVTV